MNRLQNELQRLHFSPAQQGAARVGAMVLELARPGSWDLLAKAWRGVQADLELPAPAIAVNGLDGLQLWFALAQPVPADAAARFLQRLRERYLAEVAPGRIRLVAGGGMPAGAVPPAETSPGRWSAFVAPDLAALFADEPSLDLAPGAEAQAELLSRVQAIGSDDWSRALERLGAAAEPAAGSPAESPGAQAKAPPAPPGAALDPGHFLLRVLNDEGADMALRVEAAKALLSHPERTSGSPAGPLPPLPAIRTGRYRHYKGGEYEVLGVARHSESHEPLVVYRPLYGEAALWVRPHAMFIGEVDGPQGRVPRFAFVGDAAAGS